jgi:hypothetical protein
MLIVSMTYNGSLTPCLCKRRLGKLNFAVHFCDVLIIWYGSTVSRETRRAIQILGQTVPRLWSKNIANKRLNKWIVVVSV